MDVLAGMAIMSIVVSMVFYLSTTLNEQYFALQNSRLELNDLLITSNSIICQVNTADEIHEIPDGFEIKSSHSVPIRYKKSGNQLQLVHESSSLVVSENLEELKFDYFQTGEQEQPLIQGIHLEFLFHGQLIQYHFYKGYDVGERINQQLVHVN
jgi:hypothetical protein